MQADGLDGLIVPSKGHVTQYGDVEFLTGYTPVARMSYAVLTRIRPRAGARRADARRPLVRARACRTRPRSGSGARGDLLSGADDLPGGAAAVIVEEGLGEGRIGIAGLRHLLPVGEFDALRRALPQAELVDAGSLDLAAEAHQGGRGPRGGRAHRRHRRRRVRRRPPGPAPGRNGRRGRRGDPAGRDLRARRPRRADLRERRAVLPAAGRRAAASATATSSRSTSRSSGRAATGSRSAARRARRAGARGAARRGRRALEAARRGRGAPAPRGARRRRRRGRSTRSPSAAGLQPGIWHGHGVGVDHDARSSPPATTRRWRPGWSSRCTRTSRPPTSASARACVDTYVITESGRRRLSAVPQEILRLSRVTTHRHRRRRHVHRLRPHRRAGGGELRVHKSPSTPSDPSDGVVTGLARARRAAGCDARRASSPSTSMIVHGTTVTTNAVLTERGARTGLLTTEGFRDVLEMRRGVRSRDAPLRQQVRRAAAARARATCGCRCASASTPPARC